MRRTGRRRLVPSVFALVAVAGLGGCSGSESSETPASTADDASAPSVTDGVPETSGGVETATPARRVTCAEAFSIRRAGAAPAGGRDQVGPVRFVGIQDARRRANLTEPSAARDYWTYKAPFEVTLARGSTVTISSRRGRMLIGEDTTGNAARPWSGLSRHVVIAPCPSRAGGGRHVASFPGGFALRRPGCIAVAVRRAGGSAVRHSFPLGVPSC